MYELLKDENHTLRVDLVAADDSAGWAEYSPFSLGPATTDYTCHPGHYIRGDAGQS